MRTQSGGCLCGGTRYEYAGDIGPANYCHCADCRKCTGSAFNIGVRCEAEAFRVVKGNPKSFTKKGSSGNDLTRHFCSDCGSPLFTSSPRHPEFVYVKAGSFDDPTIVKPSHQIWVSSRVAWATIGPELPAYPQRRA
jgi:hypothetical protein